MVLYTERNIPVAGSVPVNRKKSCLLRLAQWKDLFATTDLAEPSVFFRRLGDGQRRKDNIFRNLILGAFAKFRKVTYLRHVCPSVHPSVRIEIQGNS
jgi:hypothetical protein